MPPDTSALQRRNTHCGGSEATYAEIAMMSSSDRFVTTAFITPPPLPPPGAISHIEELPRDIQRLQPREPRDFAQAFQPLAVTDCAWHRLPGRSACDQRFASTDAARRHVRDETGMRVPDFRAERVRGDFKDTASDRLGASVGMELTMTARGGDERLGRRRGLDNLHPDGGLQGGEVFGGLADGRVGC